jgi:uncharacterized protein YecT (DUF1311 family)
VTQRTTTQALRTPDPELQRLEANLQNAMTQSDLNMASSQIAEYFDRKLVALEKKVEQKLDSEERKRFSKSRERWQAYRRMEVDFVAAFFEGGSILPLMANQQYSEITQHRVEELESLFYVALKGRID